MKKEEIFKLGFTEHVQLDVVYEIYQMYKESHDTEGKRTGGKNAGKVEPCILETFKTEDEIKKYINAVINEWCKNEPEELSEDEEELLREDTSIFLTEYSQLGVTGADVVSRIERALQEYGEELKEDNNDINLKELEDIKAQISK